MKQISVIFVTGLMLSVITPVFALGDAAVGKTKAAACGGCHGADGNSFVESFPKLAGQNEKYIKKQLMDFKANSSRKDPVMLGMAASLSKKDMSNIGAWYMSQELSAAAPADESQLVLGKQIYNGGNLAAGLPACSGCHGGKGAGSAGNGFPQVGGQYVAYTVKQLNAFKQGQRSNDDKSVMRKLVAKMSDADIKAVANYIATLK